MINHMNSNIKKTTLQQHQQLIYMWNECLEQIPHLFSQTQLNQIQALYIQHGYYKLLKLFHIEIGSEIVGAIGLANDKVEMILVSPRFMRQGVCNQLINHAVELGACYVDVSEHHQVLLKIFTKCGFKMMARSESDAEGYPNPILHLIKPYFTETRFVDPA